MSVVQVCTEYRAEQVHVHCGEGDCHAPLYQDWRDHCAKAGTIMFRLLLVPVAVLLLMLCF
jgi:hypothetical protein